MDSLGDYLKAERERKGIRLEEIASITKIHLMTLQHLEKGRWKDLPPEPFIRGFIVAYSKYVGLDAKDILARYRTEVGDSKSAINLPTNSQPSERSPRKDVSQTIDTAFTFPMKKLALGAGGVVGLIGIIFLISLGKKDTPGTTVAAQKVTPVAPVAEASPPPAVAAPEREVTSKAVEATPVPSPEAKATDEYAHVLAIEGKDRTWVKVVVDESPPVQYFLQAGGKAEYKAKAKIKLVLGNSAGTTIQHNGQVTEGKKLQGTIRSYIFPVDAKFPQDQPIKRETTTETEKKETPPSEDED